MFSFLKWLKLDVNIHTCSERGCCSSGGRAWFSTGQNGYNSSKECDHNRTWAKLGYWFKTWDNWYKTKHTGATFSPWEGDEIVTGSTKNLVRTQRIRDATPRRVYSGVKKRLPPYWYPLFLYVCHTLVFVVVWCSETFDKDNKNALCQ